MSNSLDPNQAQHLIGPDPGTNCLQSLSADDNCKQRIKNRSMPLDCRNPLSSSLTEN